MNDFLKMQITLILTSYKIKQLKHEKYPYNEGTRLLLEKFYESAASLVFVLQERGRIVVLGKLFWVDNCASSSGWGPNCYTWNDWHLTSQTHSVKKPNKQIKKKKQAFRIKKKMQFVFTFNVIDKKN